MVAFLTPCRASAVLFKKALGQTPGRTFQVTEVHDNKPEFQVHGEVELESQSPASGFGGPPCCCGAGRCSRQAGRG